ncbi:MAG: HDIG domain-containing protein, partial [Lacipirellulaceae bacterium]
MSNGNTQKRTRQQRVAAVELQPGVWRTLWSNLQRGGVLLRIGLAAGAALFFWAFTQSWDPPFEYQKGENPQRDLVARTDFEQLDEKATEEAKEKARKLAVAIFNQDPAPLEQMRAQLVGEITKLLAAKSWEEVDSNLWAEFQPPLAPGTPDPTDEQRVAQFERFQEAFSEEGAIDKFAEELAAVMAPFEQWGLLEPLPAEWDANFEKIEVRTKDSESFGAQKEVSEVLIENVAAKLQQSLNERLSSLELAQKVFAWLRPRLKPTLVVDHDATHLAQDEMAENEPPVTKPYRAGEDVLATAGEPLSEDAMKLLELEYQQQSSDRTFAERLQRSVSILGMFVALYTLCAVYIYAREPKIINELLRLVTLLSLVVITVALAKIINQYSSAVDVLPLLLCGMTLAIAYGQELSLLISACIALIIVLTNGHDFPQALVLTATTAGAILVLKQVRTRSKLLLVGFTAAVVGFLTTLGVGTLYGRPLPLLLEEGGHLALWSVIAGSLMTVLLPAVERAFNVLTDMRLFELGDPALPLLQELVRRAPGTYNHSITVASLAESAAEAIGARGLLVRVGAYYHDIGKM